MTPPPDIRERLAKLGPFYPVNDFVYGDGEPGIRDFWRIAVIKGLSDLPAAELAALIAKLLNEYVATLPAAS